MCGVFCHPLLPPTFCGCLIARSVGACVLQSSTYVEKKRDKDKKLSVTPAKKVEPAITVHFSMFAASLSLIYCIALLGTERVDGRMCSQRPVASRGGGELERAADL